MKLRTKLWIEQNGELVFGRGRAELLEAIDASGSISGAARRMSISYRRAWAMLSTSERRLGRTLVARSRGGATGGGAHLTDTGRALLACYRSLEVEFLNLAGEREHELHDLVG